MKREIIEKLQEKQAVEKSIEWVRKNDPELLEIFSPSEIKQIDFMEYAFFEDGVYYKPSGNEPYPIRQDNYEDLEKSYLEKFVRGYERD